ncbi:MAG: hypothetical protein AAGG72_02510 [Pseudomonadota bacterium]
MTKTTSLIGAVTIATAGIAGCASDGSLNLQTGSLGPAPTAATQTAQRIAPDPACTALANKIATLRQEGTAGRLAKVATGKTKTANVKRDALAKMAELDAANVAFQSKCAKPGVAVAPAPVAVPSAAAPAQTKATTAPPKSPAST